jgi:hypothetical protein
VRPRAPLVVLGALAITGAVAGGAWKVFEATLYDTPAPRESAPPAAGTVRAREEVVVVQVTGDVERTSPGGAWHQLLLGDRLHADDAVRTSRTGHAELAVGSAARLTLAEGTQLHVREVTAAVHRFKLTRGRIAARYQKDGARVLRVEGAEGDTVAEAEGADFSVLASGTSLAVATETGTVQLRSGGGQVDVASGRRAVATAGQPPSAPTPIPLELLLRVADASRVRSPELCAAVEGRTEPGSEVLVDGEPVQVAPDGRFAKRVLRQGRKVAAIVLTRAVDGRTSEHRLPCRTFASHRITDLNVRWKNEQEDG